MCRQPQQKSGSKQPWSNWYDHRTEEAMPLVRTGEGEGREGGRSGASAAGSPTITRGWRNAPHLWIQERGEAEVWACFREGKGKSEPKATTPRTLNKKWFSALVSVLLRIYS